MRKPLSGSLLIRSLEGKGREVVAGGPAEEGSVSIEY